MDQFIPQTGGHDLRLDDFVFMQDGYSQALAGLVSSLSPGGNCILSGCYEPYGLSPLSTFILSAGFIAFVPGTGNSEIFYFPGGSFSRFGPPPVWTTPYLKIVSNPTAPSDPVPYEDATNKNVHWTRTVTLKGYNPATDGTGDGPTLTYGPMGGPGGPGIDGMFLYAADAATMGVTGNVYLSRAATIQPGIVQEWYQMYPGDADACWDYTGLGIGRMTGYAICNGMPQATFYGTVQMPDLRGQFTFQPPYGSGMYSAANPIASIPATPVGATPRSIPAGALDISATSWTYNSITMTYGYQPTLTNGLTAGMSFGSKTSSILQGNLPAFTLPTVNLEHSHTIGLDSGQLSHSHSVCGRKAGAPIGIHDNMNADFYVVSLGDSTQADWKNNGTYNPSGAIPNSDTLLAGGQQTWMVPQTDVPFSDTVHNTGLPGAPRMISGEARLGFTDPYTVSPGLYVANSFDNTGGGFVQHAMNDTYTTDVTPGQTVFYGGTGITPDGVLTVGSGGNNQPMITSSPGYAMLKILRIF